MFDCKDFGMFRSVSGDNFAFLLNEGISDSHSFFPFRDHVINKYRNFRHPFFGIICTELWSGWSTDMGSGLTSWLVFCHSIRSFCSIVLALVDSDFSSSLLPSPKWNKSASYCFSLELNALILAEAALILTSVVLCQRIMNIPGSSSQTPIREIRYKDEIKGSPRLFLHPLIFFAFSRKQISVA